MEVWPTHEVLPTVNDYRLDNISHSLLPRHAGSSCCNDSHHGFCMDLVNLQDLRICQSLNMHPCNNRMRNSPV